MTKKNIVVIYHGNCPDGFGGAWAVWKKFRDRAEYIPVLDRKNPPAHLKNKIVYCIDWIYAEPVMRQIIAENEKVIGIDHHATSEETIKLCAEYLFSREHSGAVLAWKYFHPDKVAPKLLRYVEDVDLWKWKMPKSKEINLYIDTKRYEFSEWSGLALGIEKADRFREFVKQGSAILAFQRKAIEEIVSRAVTVEFEGHKVLAVNSADYSSEIGNVLYDKKPPFAIVWRAEGSKNRVSLRSNGKVDVAKIAEKYGGGGHPAAAGFFLEEGEKLPWKIVHEKN